MARGRQGASAMEKIKWFNTNYPFIVPELTTDIRSAFRMDILKVGL